MRVKFANGTHEVYEDEVFKSGGEGETYRSLDQRHLVKLYYNQTNQAYLRERIDNLITQYNPTLDDPYWRQFFAWPQQCVVEVDGQPKIGFRMRYVTQFKALEHYIFQKAFNRLPPEERGWFPGRIAVAIKLASAAQRLASLGLCYPDFSDRNILVDAFAGKMVLIDCDSLSVPGLLAATVEGSDWYRAPEIISKEVLSPSPLTDRHNVAVLLYLWLLTWHPLVGDRITSLDADSDDTLSFGKRALYIEHPTDHSNRAKHQAIRSDALGPELQALFQQAFVTGLHDPQQRPTPEQWLAALYRAYDRLLPCVNAACEWRYFIATPTAQLTCPKCGTVWPTLPHLLFMALLPDEAALRDFAEGEDSSRYTVAGWPGRTLHQWHFQPDVALERPDDPEPYATFAYEPTKEAWYLINERCTLLRTRAVTDAEGEWSYWPRGAAVPLTGGTVLQFGSEHGQTYAHVSLIEVN